MSDEDALLTPKEVSERLRVGEHALYQWRRRGYGPAFVYVGRLVRYRGSAVEAFLALEGQSSTQASLGRRTARAGVVASDGHGVLPDDDLP